MKWTKLNKFILFIFLFLNCYSDIILPEGTIKTDYGYKNVKIIGNGIIHIKYWNKNKILIIEKKMIDGYEYAKYYDRDTGEIIREFKYLQKDL